ncbi:MAG: tRNA guanosine(34) transglycosylase Tgt [Gemmatimonadota bacterium]
MTPSARAFRYELRATEGAARTGRFHTPHGPVETPAFMPVGTLGAVKTLSPHEVEAVGASMILANTYHLYLRPGAEEVEALGGLHDFMRWDGPILTDSGGYQVFSLAGINEIGEEGVVFQSHIDGSRHLFTPEKVMEIQRSLGADVIMAFDECPPGGCSSAEAREASERTLRWLERCRTRFEEMGRETDGPAQSLFPVLQGNIYPQLRVEHARDVRGMGDWDGYGIGGLSVGEAKQKMWTTLETLHPELPADRPRYLMGVGYPDDLLEAIARGCDLFDCVAPTRNARHGTAWTTHDGQVNLKAARFRLDSRPLDRECDGYCCRHFDRAYLRHLTVAGEAFAHRLLSIHNVRFLVRLAEDARGHVRSGDFGSWSEQWLERYRMARG